MTQKWEEREWEYYREVIDRFDMDRGNASTVVKEGAPAMKESEAESAREL